MSQSISNRSSPIFGDSLPGYGNKSGGLFSPWEHEAAPDYGEEEAELFSPSSLNACEDAAPPRKRRRTGTISSATTSSVTEVASQALKNVRPQPSKASPLSPELLEAYTYVKEHQKITPEQLDELQKQCWVIRKESGTPRFDWSPPLIQALFSFAKHHTKNNDLYPHTAMGIRSFLNDVCHVPINFIPQLVVKSHFQASYYYGAPVDNFDWGEAPENTVSSRTAIASPRRATRPSNRFDFRRYIQSTAAARPIMEPHALLEITEACAYLKEHTRVTDEQKNLIKEKCFIPASKTKPARFDWIASPLAQAVFSFAKYVLTKRQDVIRPTKIAQILRDCNISEEVIPLDAIRKRLSSSRQLLHPSDEFDWEGAIITNNREN